MQSDSKVEGWEKRQTTGRAHTHCSPPYNSWVQHQPSSCSGQPTRTAVSMPPPWGRLAWSWSDQAGYGFRVAKPLWKGSIVYEDEPPDLSFELHVRGCWQSVITPVWCWFHSFTRCRAGLGPVQMPTGLLREEPRRQLGSGPGSIVGTSTCSFTQLLPLLTSFLWCLCHVPRLLRAVCIWATAISWGI